MPKGTRGSNERREKPNRQKTRKQGKTAQNIKAPVVKAQVAKVKAKAVPVAKESVVKAEVIPPAQMPTVVPEKWNNNIEKSPQSIDKNNVLLPNPFKSGEKWGNVNYNKSWNALNSTEKKRSANSLQKKLNAPKTKKNAMKLLDNKCKAALNIKIPYENKHSKRNKTKEVYITVENALEGCHTENSGCKFLHTACRKKGKQECRFSILKRQAIGILQKHCPEHFDTVKDFLVN